ncbi:unnamed protein product [Lathyrus oleraceus]
MMSFRACSMLGVFP